MVWAKKAAAGNGQKRKLKLTLTIIATAHTSNSTLPILIKMILDEPHNQTRIENKVMLKKLFTWCQREDLQFKTWTVLEMKDHME
jgi:hypothetical protein